MRQLRRIDWALVFLTTIILLMGASGAVAGDWEPSWITLKPGENVVVEFTTDSAPVPLEIDNMKTPPELLSLITFTPSEISENLGQNVTIEFTCPSYVEQLIHDGIAQKMYIFDVNGLLVCLDLSVPLPEDAEDRWAALEVSIDALGVSLTNQIENLAARITVLESVEQKNWEPEFEALWENLYHFDDWTTSKITELWEAIPKNSPPSDTSEWYAALDNLEDNLRRESQDIAAQLKRDSKSQIAKAKADAEYNTMIWSIGSALAVLCGVGVYFSIRGKSLRKSTKAHKRHPSDDEGEDNPAKTQRQW